MDPPAPISAPAPKPAATTSRRAALPTEAFFRPGPTTTTPGARARALESSTRTDSDAIRKGWSEKSVEIARMPADQLPEPFLFELLAELEAQYQRPA
jgi:hypothetical protein